jgi:hypothetical protein
VRPDASSDRVGPKRLQVELSVEQFILAPIKFEKNDFKKKRVAAAAELKMRRVTAGKLKKVLLRGCVI